jgi:hypothetical protein
MYSVWVCVCVCVCVCVAIGSEEIPLQSALCFKSQIQANLMTRIRQHCYFLFLKKFFKKLIFLTPPKNLSVSQYVAPFRLKNHILTKKNWPGPNSIKLLHP